MEIIRENYSYVHCVNLMKKGKSDEQLINEEFEKHIKNSDLNWVKYDYFDFHHECKNQKYEKVNPLIRKLRGMNDNFKFYLEDIR
jgi:hypothetical protein